MSKCLAFSKYLNFNLGSQSVHILYSSTRKANKTSQFHFELTKPENISNGTQSYTMWV